MSLMYVDSQPYFEEPEAPSLVDDDVMEPDDPRYLALQAAAGEADRRLAKSLAWPAFARALGAPPVQEGMISERTAREIKKLLDSYPGGVAGYISAWTPEDSSQQADAFFAPWGKDLGEDMRQRIMAVMRRYEREDIRSTLWSSARMQATTKRAAKRARDEGDA